MERKYMHARRELEAVEEGRLQLARLHREVQHLENQCTSVTQRYTDRTGSSREVHNVLWDQLADKRQLLLLQQHVQEQREQEVLQWIELLPNPRWKLLLRCRYLEGMDLQDILQTLEEATGRPFTMNQVYRIHSQALGAVEKLLPM